jgi:hypothetical protein
MEDYEIENVINLCIEGLRTDGGHHKQWYLEHILLAMIPKEKWDELKRKKDWKKGIAP